MNTIKKSLISAAILAACIVAPATSHALWIPNVKATASSFDTLNFEGFGVFSLGGQQLIPGSFGGFGGAAIGSVREEFSRGPWQMVNGQGMGVITPGTATTNPVLYANPDTFNNANGGWFQHMWLSQDGPLSGPKTFDIYPARDVKDIVTPADGTRYNFPGNDIQPVLNFDLGGLYDLTSFQVWNWAEASGDGIFVNGLQGVSNDQTFRGVRDVTIEGSADGVNYSVLGGRRLPRANQFQAVNNLYTGSQVSLVATEVQFLRFTILNNWAGDLANTNVPAGIAEIRFNGAFSVIPEPSAAGLLAVPALALVRRRRA